MPFYPNTFDKQNLKYLTAAQAMEDFNVALKHIRKTYDSEFRAVIAFGGSYGGMLAAWMRMKYPHQVQGAHAASAPVLFFPGVVNPYGF